MAAVWQVWLAEEGMWLDYGAGATAQLDAIKQGEAGVVNADGRAYLVDLSAMVQLNPDTMRRREVRRIVRPRGAAAATTKASPAAGAAGSAAGDAMDVDEGATARPRARSAPAPAARAAAGAAAAAHAATAGARAPAAPRSVATTKATAATTKATATTTMASVGRRDLKVGEEVALASDSNPEVKYRVKRVGDHYSCTCPAWRFQTLAVNERYCKHLGIVAGMAKPARSGAMAGGRKRATPAAAAGGAATRRARASDFKFLLASKWDEAKDVTGWLMSEKLDGIRALWDGEQLVSRLGNAFPVPDAVRAKLPAGLALDGELFMGRGRFHDTVSMVKSSGRASWPDVRFHVFDGPQLAGAFADRLAELAAHEAFAAHPDLLVLVEHRVVGSHAEVHAEVERIVAAGGEGVMLRDPASAYVNGRSSSLLKCKRFLDAEARVEGHEPGKGRHTGVLGAVVCSTSAGVKFRVGTGFTDAQRRDPPAIGALITFRYQELTPSGAPRFPSFVGPALDKPGPTI